MEFKKMVTMTLYARQQDRHRCKEQTVGLPTQTGSGSGFGLPPQTGLWDRAAPPPSDGEHMYTHC